MKWVLIVVYAIWGTTPQIEMQEFDTFKACDYAARRMNLTLNSYKGSEHFPAPGKTFYSHGCVPKGGDPFNDAWTEAD